MSYLTIIPCYYFIYDDFQIHVSICIRYVGDLDLKLFENESDLPLFNKYPFLAPDTCLTLNAPDSDFCLTHKPVTDLHLIRLN